MASDDFERERPRASQGGGSACLYWTLGCGGLGLLTILLCCGGVGYFGVNMMSAEVELALRDNAQIREHLGELRTVRVNLVKSLSHEGDETWVYDLTGDKGKGELTTNQTTDFEGDEQFHSATLRLSDGKTVEIDLKPKAEPEPPVQEAKPMVPAKTGAPAETKAPAETGEAATPETTPPQ